MSVILREKDGTIKLYCKGAVSNSFKLFEHQEKLVLF